MTEGDHEAKSKPFLKSSVYDFFKRATQYYLPAFAAAYFSLAGIWGLPNAEQVVGTVAVVEIFIGAILGVSNVNYKNSDARFDGVMHVGPEKNGLVLNSDVESLESKSELVFKVNADGSGTWPIVSKPGSETDVQ